MYSAFKIQIHPHHKLFSYCDSMCFKAKNLFNITNFFVRQVFTAVHSEDKNENQLEVLKEIEKHLPAMNDIRCKNYKRALVKPKKKDKKGNEIQPKLKLFSMPDQRNSFLGYEFVEALFKVTKQVDYVAMPSQSNQQTMRALFKDWKSFFESNKKYKINPNGFTGKPKIPKYKPKNGRTTCYLTNQITRLNAEHQLELPDTEVTLPLGKLGSSTGVLQQVRIIPVYGRFTIEVIFKGTPSVKAIIRSEKEKKTNDFVFEPKRIMGIDMGVDNLATIIDNTGQQPLLIKGTWLKSINQYYNKLRGEYMSILRNGKNPKEGMFTSTRLLSLDRKRNNRVMDFLHKSSSLVVNVAIERTIDTIIIGKNAEWKLNVEMKKSDKQNFIQIPYSTFIEMVRYKAERLGIQVIVREESYTSKSSFLNGDEIPTYGEKCSVTFSGYRKTRAFYKIKGEKTLIHADVNGAFNIVRKHVPTAFDGLERKYFLQSPRKIVVIKPNKNAKLKASA
jgi:putative transposase